MTTLTRRGLAASVAFVMSLAMPALASAASASAPGPDGSTNTELGQRGGRPEAPEAPFACMQAVKAKMPHPDQFRWTASTTRRVAEDVYSVVGAVEFVNQAGEARKGDVQCDVMRAPGNQFIVPKIRLPQ
ncbi:MULTISPECIES: DUF2880 domain-containing protein [unclassified Cupriavidus]|uniref:DUF2880 domain-containing protein n=1 Tax=unclassified Cupriavidus TaxID=2640874 RepID=UPI0010FA2B26|nr:MULTISPECIES: DUF2880 domain-containing protein [unclassified Cupriavidus]MWL90157.1 DUF2880 domain-containing protein [Cupriavidus sp. SW-Y-13]